MEENKNYIDEVRKESREKFGRFYYSDKIKMDWEKPEKQNVTGGIPENHNGFCIASDTIENFWIEKLQQVEQRKVEEIIEELGKDQVVILPMDGQALGNPNFTSPGPPRHMVLVRGWDPETQEFVTNDPGTRKGRGYRYGKEVLWEAIRDYPSGEHLPIFGREKWMIVVGR